jgi:glycosyltransferase involved in cell wall biosynthesis
VFEQAGDFDLIHNSFDFLPLTYSRLVDAPVLTTIHGFSSDRILPVYQKYNDETHYVAISDADRHPTLDYAATIHHGIEMDRFHLVPETGEYLLFYGRIHPDKGTASAVEVARNTGLPLVIAGIVQDAGYFDREIAPHLDGERVTYLGPVSRQQGAELLGGARALLHLIDFEEPFGLSVVEAMACGTPVIAQRRGSMPEIVEEGVNGFMVDSARAAVDAVSHSAGLDRSRVRQSVELRFGVDRMVSEYLSLYRRIVSG